MARKREPLDGSQYSPWQVLEAANAYYALSTVFTSRHQSLQEGQESDMSESVASATNRILALELYIKAILIAVPLPVPMKHDLLELFAVVPEWMRTSVTRKFDEATKADPKRICARVDTAFQLKGVHTEVNFPRESVVLDPSLISLLERNKDGFANSRYLFENARWEEVAVYRYEHPRLALICKILCETLEEELGDHPLDYKRAFSF